MNDPFKDIDTVCYLQVKKNYIIALKMWQR